jgi:hypothetical protein
MVKGDGMRSWIRRARAAAAVGLLWAGGWFGAGMVMLVIVGPHAADVPFPLFFGFLGFLAGATFSGVLALAERRRRFEQMSVPGFAGWGALGGLLLAGVLVLSGGGSFPLLGSIFALAGGASAAGTLLLARKGEAREIGGQSNTTPLGGGSDDPGQ